MYWMHPFGWGSPMMIIWWVIIIAIIVAIAKRLTQRKGQQTKEDSAIEILQKRYARGEISKEEFEKKKKIWFRHDKWKKHYYLFRNCNCLEDVSL